MDSAGRLRGLWLNRKAGTAVPAGADVPARYGMYMLNTLVLDCLKPMFKIVRCRSGLRDRRFLICRHQARAAFCAAFITVFFIRFSPAQYKLISWPSGSLR
jgi:hypothetical protein